MGAEEASQVLREYAGALYATALSKREVRTDLLLIAEQLNPSPQPIQRTLPQLRDLLGLCPQGHGHWQTYCGRIGHPEPLSPLLRQLQGSYPQK